MATDQDKMIDAAISTLIDHAEGSYRGDLGDIEQEIDEYLAALRRDRETLRKVKEIVERRDAYPYSASEIKRYYEGRMEQIRELVREQEQGKGNA